MGRGSLQNLQELGLSSSSFSSTHGNVLQKPNRRLLAIASAGLGLVLCLALIFIGHQSGSISDSGSTQLTADNQFEDQDAWDSNWDIDEFRHHFVQTQRLQTEINKKRDEVIAKLDAEVEELMDKMMHRPPGPAGPVGKAGAVGPPGKDGNKGPPGDQGPNGKNGQPGPNGPPGSNGPNGQDGVVGQKGAPGDNGREGLAGQPGLSGRNGVPGLPGVPGPQGPEGGVGPLGPTGVFSGVHVIHHVTNSDYYRPAPPPADDEESMPYWQYDEARAQRDKAPGPISLRQADAAGAEAAAPLPRGEEGGAAAAPAEGEERGSRWGGEAAAAEGYRRAAEEFKPRRPTSSLRISLPAPPPNQKAEEGYKRRGSIAVSKVDAHGYYYLNIIGEASHKLSAVLQGTDGYHRRWQGLDQIYTGPLKAASMGSKDFLKVQDLSTGETQYFRFKFA